MHAWQRVRVGMVLGVGLAWGGCGPQSEDDLARRSAQPLLAVAPEARPELNPSFEPEAQPLPGFARYDLLVLTPHAFRVPALLLAAHKQTTGMPTLVQEVEAIAADPAYAAGRDLQERLKLALHTLWRRHQLKYVLLLGDADTFPVRWIWSQDLVFYGRRYQPSDLYFGDLLDPADTRAINDRDDGLFSNWDANGDGRFAEFFAPEGFSRSWADLNRDRLDAVPEVAIGRVPASTVDEALRMVVKIVDYEQLAAPSWAKRALVITGDWDNPNGTADQIAAALQGDGYSISKHYWNPGDPSWGDPAKVLQRRATLRAAFASGYGVVSYLGHGASDVWAGWYTRDDVADADTGTRLPIVFAAACETARFHVAEGRYRDRQGNLIECSVNLIDGDATFRLLRDTAQPDRLRLDTVNLPTVHSAARADNGELTIVAGGGQWFMRTAPQDDPRRYWHSLQAYGDPTRYLRHQGYRGKLTVVASTLDRQDASLRAVPGLAAPWSSNADLVSLESWNYPGWYLVDDNGALRLQQRLYCNADFDRRATFEARPGLAAAAALSLRLYAEPTRFIRERDGLLYVEAGSGAAFNQQATFVAVAAQADPTPSYASLLQPGTSNYIQRGLNGNAARVQPVSNDGERPLATFRLLPALDRGVTDPNAASLEAVVPAPAGRLVRSLGARVLRHTGYVVYTHESRPARQADLPEPAALQTPVGDAVVEVDSLAEEFLVKHDHGAIAYLGAFTGTQFAAMTLNRLFFEELAARHGGVLGDAWRAALGRLVAEVLAPMSFGGWGPGAAYDHLHKMMLYGDPSLRVGGLP